MEIYMLFVNGFFIWSLTLFGDRECNAEFSISFSGEILTTYSIFAFLLLFFLLHPFLPIDFGAPFKAKVTL